MKRVIILVIDSLGIGAMEDYADYREADRGADTFRHILDYAEVLFLPNFAALGAGNLLHHKRLPEAAAPLACYGALRLMHQGADSYLGHQEIMGSKPLPPLIQPFERVLPLVAGKLRAEGYAVEASGGLLIVNGCVTVADNIETDFGQIYNVTGALDVVSYEEILKIGAIVRANVSVARVIALGGRGIGIGDLLAAAETTPEGAVGVNCPKSGVYRSGYRVQHMGFGINADRQVSSICVKNGVPVTLIGKMADVIECRDARKIFAVETENVMAAVIDSLHGADRGLISATVQETDLSGHMEDVNRYAAKLNTVDAYLGTLLRECLREDDLLMITADHGNDPTIGHSHHTREKTFLLAYRKGARGAALGERATLSDVAATACQALGLPACENGESFLESVC